MKQRSENKEPYKVPVMRVIVISPRTFIAVSNGTESYKEKNEVNW